MPIEFVADQGKQHMESDTRTSALEKEHIEWNTSLHLRINNKVDLWLLVF